MPMTPQSIRQVKNVIILETTLQNGANGFISWCMSNKMFINILKTVFMLLGSRQNLMRTEQIKLYIENHVILGTEQQKLLGVIIDKNLKACLHRLCNLFATGSRLENN